MTRAAERAEAARLLGLFAEAGADPVECAVLQPAGLLLDLYGEEIRGRAFTTQDAGGEMMLRPDFTVPVVEMHMAEGRAPARYAYAGEIFRRQDTHPERPIEYLQAGIELFGDEDRAAADAEVFALIYRDLAPLRPRIVTGDVGILTAAIRGLPVSERRRAALMRHVWRPRRFRALLDRYAGRSPVPPARAHLLAAEDPFAGAGPEIGLRSRAEVAERIETLRTDAAEPPIPAAQMAHLDTLLGVAGPSGVALNHLRDLAVDLPAIQGAVDAMARRLDALTGAGIDAAALPFEGSHGRSTMEYYDGFVFSFALPNRPDLPPLATGGRYDALTRALGGGRGSPAVGGVIRPAIRLAGHPTEAEA